MYLIYGMWPELKLIIIIILHKRDADYVVDVLINSLCSDD